VYSSATRLCRPLPRATAMLPSSPDTCNENFRLSH
jgi:hypothetical protein